jgi:predicted metal-dependent hydrolase
MEVDACFYPYIGLTHTIRRKSATWIVRISDHCRHASSPVLEAIVRILASKIMRRRPRPKYLQTYELFRNDPWIKEAVRERRLRRGRKHIAEESGTHHSLRELYRELNDRYFNNQIEIHKIGWGLRRSRLRLGHYDPVHHTITLSPMLDAPDVPQFVVRYIVYHEMLHAVFESTAAGRIIRHHTSEFRRAEKAYPDFETAKKFLGEYCARTHQKDRRRHSGKYGIKPNSH